MNQPYVHPSILTASGRPFDFVYPTRCQVDILDIAHALSNLCRFNGHTRSFYSVAQHSVMAATIVPPEHALAALLHDAHEAYIGDVSTPLKQLVPTYRDIERQIAQRIRGHFAVPLNLSPEVEHADMVMLATEKRDLMPATDQHWVQLDGIEPLPIRISPQTPERARADFLSMYYALTIPVGHSPSRQCDCETCTAYFSL